jgi:hypothetical protein
MVSKGDRPQALVPGHLEDFPWRMLSIRGSVGVNMQVNHRMLQIEKKKYPQWSLRFRLINFST